MGGFSPMHWIIIAIVLVLVLGGGRFSNMMGDVAKGVKQFKKGMAEEDDAAVKRDPARIETRGAVEPVINRETVVTREGEQLREERGPPGPPRPRPGPARGGGRGTGAATRAASRANSARASTS